MCLSRTRLRTGISWTRMMKMKVIKEVCVKRKKRRRRMSTGRKGGVERYRNFFFIVTFLQGWEFVLSLFAQEGFAPGRSFVMSDLSDSLLSLCKQSKREKIALVALIKRASLTSLMTKKWQWANRSQFLLKRAMSVIHLQFEQIALIKRAIRSIKTYLLYVFLQFFTVFPPFYAQERIPPVALYKIATVSYSLLSLMTKE